LLSLLAAAGAASVIFLLACRVMRSTFLALWISALFAFTSTYWSQGVIGEVYTLHVLLISALILLYFKLERSSSERDLYLFALLLGFVLLHHLMTVLLAPAFAILLLQPNHWRLTSLRLPYVRWRPRIVPVPRWDQGYFRWFRLKTLGRASVFLLFPLIQLVYIPLRYTATTIVGWGTLNNYESIFAHITGRQFRPIMFTFNEFVLSRSIEGWKTLLLDQFVHFGKFQPVLILAALGAVYLLVNRFSMFAFFALLYVVNAGFAINYTIVDIDVYYIQGYLALAFFAGAGLLALSQTASWLVHRRPRPTAAIRWTALAVIPAVLLTGTVLQNYHTNDRSQNFLIHDYGLNVLGFLDHNSILLTQGWSLPFLFSYMQEVVDMRRDVWIVIDNFGGFLKRLIENRRTRTKPIYSNTPLEIMTERSIKEEPFGLVYRVGDYPFYHGRAVDVWPLLRLRGIEDPTVDKDFHNSAVTAMYAYLRGEFLFSQDLPDQALELYKLAGVRAFDNEMIHNNLSAILFKRGFLEQSEIECRKALEISPGFMPAKHNLANIYFEQGRYNLALRVWDQIPNPQYLAYAMRARGLIHMKNGDYEQAVRCYEEARRQDPKSHEILNNLGAAYLGLGRLWPAERSFRDLLRYYPDSPDGLNNLASVLIQKGEWNEAEELARNALKMKPDFLDAHSNMGIVLAQKQDLTGAEEQFNRVLEQDPKNVTAMNNLALVYFHQGEFDRAKDLWTRSLFFKPGQLKVLANLDELGKRQNGAAMASANTTTTPLDRPAAEPGATATAPTAKPSPMPGL